MATQTETIQVGGVRCERCVMRLAHTLEGHEGLEAANANLMGQVTLAWDDEQTSREDSTRRHWDAWPRPEYGTLEVRVMDQPTSLRRTAEFAAEVQQLVREAAETGGEPLDRGEYEAARQQAAREGGGPEAERQLELGPEAAVREIAARTLG